jgi:DsbC/DsbD-like thiol-disulfide interchange protein
MKSPRKFPFAGLMMAWLLVSGVLINGVLINLPGVPAAFAQDASSWDTQPHTASRLIAGAASKNATATFLHAGIEIKLDPGWKTYWRDPGDSGAPPTFDFSGSQNVKSVDVRWPAPERFPDGAGGNSIGYLDHMILPLRVVPQNAAKQTQLQIRLGYDICSNICIPVEANLKLPLGNDGAEEAAIEKAEIRVPRQVTLGQEPVKNAVAQDVSGQSGRLAILAVHRQPGGAHDRVVVDVAAPAGATVDLFAEGPNPDWSLPLPEQTGIQGNVRQFSFDLDGLPPDAQAEGATLTLTAVSGDDAIEVAAHLD